MSPTTLRCTVDGSVATITLARPEKMNAFNADMHAELRDALDRALTALPEAQRRTFVLHVDGGLSYREVADALDISIGTVMSRLFYARQRLKLLLASHVLP